MLLIIIIISILVLLLLSLLLLLLLLSGLESTHISLASLPSRQEYETDIYTHPHINIYSI